jgi:sugar phosphate isomerase/epimerase
LLTRRDFLVGTTLGAAALPFLHARGAASTTYQLGCYTRPWDQYEYRVALDGIAEAGFKYAGIMTAKGKTWVIVNVDSTIEEIATLSQEVKKRGLKTLSIYGGEFPVAKSIEAGIEGLKKLIDHCRTCDCPHLLLGGTTEEKLVAPYYKVVAECCAYAVEKGVTLTIKPHGGQNATGPQCRKIIEEVGWPSFRLWYDPGNIFYYSDGKLDPVTDCATVDGLVAGMSIKDFKPPKEVLVTPGSGQVDFPKVMKRLRQGGFTSGPIVVECLNRAATAPEITREAVKARTFLEQLIR